MTNKVVQYFLNLNSKFPLLICTERRGENKYARCYDES